MKKNNNDKPVNSFKLRAMLRDHVEHKVMLQKNLQQQIDNLRQMEENVPYVVAEPISQVLLKMLGSMKVNPSLSFVKDGKISPFIRQGEKLLVDDDAVFEECNLNAIESPVDPNKHFIRWILGCPNSIMKLSV